jgi:pSer/pThr/pTyr-binding forkhead associated (FHA) protein
MAILRLHRHGAPPLTIDHDRVLVGRDTACDVVIDDKSVSRRHAALERRGVTFVVTDQGSANGSFVNGAQVSEATLYDGQELRLGMVPFRVEIESEADGTIMMSAPPQVPSTVMMPSPVAALAAPAPVPAPPVYAPAAPPAYAPPVPPPPANPREQAAAVLGVEPHASVAEVRARLTELTSDLEARLQQARTPNLKATYQKNLDEAKRAADLLAPGLATVDVQDLPSVQPMVVPDEMDISIPAPVRAALVHLDESAPERQSGVPAKATTILSFTAMTLIAVCAYFSLSKGKMVKELNTKNASPEYKDAVSKQALYGPMDTLEKAGVLKNGALKLCNKTGSPLEVLWLGATYGAPDKEGGLAVKTYNSQFCEDFKLTIPAGGQVPVSVKGAQENCTWDGLGLFASVIVQHPQDPNRQLYAARPIQNGQACLEIGGGL